MEHLLLWERNTNMFKKSKPWRGRWRKRLPLEKLGGKKSEEEGNGVQ